MEFEKALSRLNEISEKMNSKDLPLDDSVKLYKEACELVKFCKEYIDNARLQVERLEEAQ